MYERHENEQYFFDESTVEKLLRFLERWESVCCLCAPSVGAKMVEQGRSATILDIDERFAGVQGFVLYNIYRPVWIEKKFDLIICDPPFFNVSLSTLFSTLRMLSQNDFKQKLLVSYLDRRADAILGTFAPFELAPTGFFPTYKTVDTSERNRIQFFGNVDYEVEN